MNVNNSFICDRKRILEIVIDSRNGDQPPSVSLSGLRSSLVCRDLNTEKFHDKPPQAALELIRNRRAPKNMRTFKRRVAIKITCACVKQMVMSDVLPTCMSV